MQKLINALVLLSLCSSAACVSDSNDMLAPAPGLAARRISDERDLIRGPLAHSRIGDYLLQNEVARFVIQDVAQRDQYSIAGFGGNLIDAELIARPGMDNFLEIAPSLNVETVINADSVEILNDGQDGNAAIIRTCGPDDLLDYVNPSSLAGGLGFTFPDIADDRDLDVEACTDYILESGDSYLRMTTTVMNNEAEEVGLFVGDYINGAGETEQFTSSEGGIGEIATARLGVLSYVGFGEALGVDYSHVTVPFSGGRPFSTFFTQSGVSFVLQGNSISGVLLGGAIPFFKVPAGSSNSFTRFFGVGDGSVNNAIALEAEVKERATGTVQGCVRSEGSAVPGARVSVGRTSDGGISALVTQFVTGDDGCYQGRLPVGDYGLAAAKRGLPYEGNERFPQVHLITIVADQSTEQDIELPEGGRVMVSVIDENASPVPARVSIVGLDPSPELPLVVSTVAGSQRTGTFRDISRDQLPFGLVSLEYTDVRGAADLAIEPGRYDVVVSRGAEYSMYREMIEVAAGQTIVVDAQIARVIDTAGFVSSDFHVHGIRSPDSRVSDRDRVHQFAGEGVDNIVMTDHEAHADLNPKIAELGFSEFVHATIGEEITTFEYGHFNSYPRTIDNSRPSGGSTDWGRPAPIGKDFPSEGAYSAIPSEIFDLATDGPTSIPATTIQINHIDSHFEPLRIDTSLVPPQSLLSADELLAFRLNPDSGNVFHHFPALELWNGNTRGHQAEFLDERIGIWFNLLNQGMRTTAISDTDTHTFINLRTSGARTWTAASSDRPAEVDPSEVAASVDAGRAVGGQGLYVQARLVAGDGSVADLSLSGSTTISSTGAGVDLEIRVQAPVWAEYDRIEIYANAETVVAGEQQGVPVLFSALPTLVLEAGTDFDIEVIDVVPSVSGAKRFETNLVVPFHDLSEDTWFVVLVRGTDGVSQPLFPVSPSDLSSESNSDLDDLLDGNLGEGGVTALGVTNALYYRQLGG